MILLTGGTGFVGRHLTSQFVTDGRRVRVLSRAPGRVPLPDAVSWARGDLAEPAALQAALRDVRTVVHAAALLAGGPTPGAAFERVNARGTETLARVARDAGVRQFIHISSAAIYGEGPIATPHSEDSTLCPGTLYQRSKLLAEHALTAALDGSDVHWTILRPPELYGPDRPQTIAFFRAVARRRLWLHGPARAIVQPTHVADLIAAVRLVIDRDDLRREVINIGGSQILEFRDFISLIGVRVGNVPLQLSAPPWTRPLAGLASQAWAAVGKPPAILTRLSRAWTNRALNIEKARSLLGFEPVALEWGLDQTVSDMRRNGLL